MFVLLLTSTGWLRTPMLYPNKKEEPNIIRKLANNKFFVMSYKRRKITAIYYLYYKTKCK